MLNNKIPEHALLSCSGADRWIHCPSSLVLGKDIPEKSSEYSLEGTLAHTIFQSIIEDEFANKIDIELKNNSNNNIIHEKNFDTEIIKNLSSVLPFIYSVILNERSNVYYEIYSEKQVNLDLYIPESFGTVDLIIIKKNAVNDKILSIDILDLKYGKGKYVEVKKNTQLTLYLLGTVLFLDLSFNELQNIEMTMHIVQPRLDNFKSYKIPYNSFLEFIDFVTPKAVEAFSLYNSGTLQKELKFNKGTHCLFCKCKNICPEHKINYGFSDETNANEFKNYFDIETEKMSYLETNSSDLQDEKISLILNNIEKIEAWIVAFKDFAFRKAKEGTNIIGYDLKFTTPKRIYTDKAKENLVQFLTNKGYNNLTEVSIVAISKLEKILNVDDMQNLLEEGFIGYSKSTEKLQKI